MQYFVLDLAEKVFGYKSPHFCQDEIINDHNKITIELKNIFTSLNLFSPPNFRAFLNITDCHSQKIFLIAHKSQGTISDRCEGRIFFLMKKGYHVTLARLFHDWLCSILP